MPQMLQNATEDDHRVVRREFLPALRQVDAQLKELGGERGAEYRKIRVGTGLRCNYYVR